ncbi:hypothetical protein EYF80_058367 [Liparis tanakae]|uniref:Uncharacterized protein n=1 Tax=Liparis tanakae TaxID=230148 RepID=A0A4Z2ERS8_9TELE|nr:hypothetical protein EYF80_058367 [Liparis tanakae]
MRRPPRSTPTESRAPRPTGRRERGDVSWKGKELSE